MKINLMKCSLFFFLLFSCYLLQSEVVISSTSKVSSEWADGYIVNVDITNNQSTQIKEWKVTFTLPANQAIDRLWSGKYVATEKNITVRNESWNGTLEPNQTVTFDVQISGSATPGILNLKAVGEDVCTLQEPEPNAPLFVNIVPNIHVISTWPGGKQITIELVNLTDSNINHFIIEFDLGLGEIITGLCGGEFTANHGHIIVTSPLWMGGGTISVGGKATVSLILKSETATQSLTNVIATGNFTSNVEGPIAPLLNPIVNDDKDGNYTVAWKAVSGAIRYTIEESTDSSFSNPITTSINTLQKIFQGQAEGTYYYRVAAVNQNITSPFSNVQSVTVLNSPPPIGTPLLSRIDNSNFDDRYMVSWSAVENATEYIVEESNNVNFNNPIEVYNGSDTRKTFSFKPIGSYYYRVKAKNSSQEGTMSNVEVVIVNKTTSSGSVHKIVGYFPNWAMYRAKPFYAKDINPELITHINYAFAAVEPNGTIRLFDPWSDTDFYSPGSEEKSYAGNFYQLYQLKKQKPDLKTLISLGGWTLSDTFSEMATTPAVRERFAQNCVDFCKKYDFDGIDIDWEYPGFADHNGRPADTANFTLLLQAVSAKLKAENPPLLLTIAAPASPHHYRNMEVAKIHQYLDWLNIMAYDFHGPWTGDEDTITNHLAPLLPTEEGNPNFNVTSAVDYYLSQGVPKEKIILGMPLYGRSFAAADNTPTGLYSLYTGPGYATNEEMGYVFFSDIQNNLLETYDAYWDSKALGAYIYNCTTKDFISYDNDQSFILKSQFIKDRGLGGAMLWELGMDTMPDWKMLTLLNNQLKE